MTWMEDDPGLREEFKKRRHRCEAGAHRINARYLLDGGQPAECVESVLEIFRRFSPNCAQRMAPDTLLLSGNDRPHQPAFRV